MRSGAVRFGVGMLIGCLALSAADAGAEDDPKSQGEVDQRYPMPQRFDRADLAAVQRLAQAAVPVMNSALNDYPSTRFRNVRAVFQADWRSTRHFYHFCGELNAKNPMGAYSGWRPFLITGNPGGAPDFSFSELDAAIVIPMICGRGREDRILSDWSINYGKLLSAR